MNFSSAWRLARAVRRSGKRQLGRQAAAAILDLVGHFRRLSSGDLFFQGVDSLLILAVNMSFGRVRLSGEFSKMMKVISLTGISAGPPSAGN